MSCKQASRLISDGMDRPLSRSEQVRLSFHLLLCRNCRHFRQQMQQLRSGIRRARDE
ncbi:zf-HC2 domain-containing protein [Vogesella sp. XCS3]|uniref:zf-HC2 domain-containing protein n=1 Tax=Vogesella sp. XCS3 TaxID=2877939 RepID=UPI001D0A6110|nr:zf-HC2 domain-containing protein [Vogesella sp. XCS3]UDM17386.1 zf-HC2 domain-containing protein [Vogesella sp. XCS3]